MLQNKHKITTNYKIFTLPIDTEFISILDTIEKRIANKNLNSFQQIGRIINNKFVLEI